MKWFETDKLKPPIAINCVTTGKFKTVTILAGVELTKAEAEYFLPEDAHAKKINIRIAEL